LKKTLLIVLIGVFLVSCNTEAAFAEAKDTLISVRADYWMPSIDAEVTSSEFSVVGTKIDLIDDLGLDDSENIPAIRGSLDLPLFPEILVSYFAVDSSATKTLTKSLTYKGKTYSVAETVASKYDITQYEALLVFPLINQDAGKLGFLFGAKYFEVESELNGSVTGDNKESVEGPVPVIGANIGIGLGEKIKIEGLARGLVLEIQDLDASLFDIEVDLTYDFNRALRAYVGYRYFSIDAEDTSTKDKVDIKFAGPVAGVTLSF